MVLTKRWLLNTECYKSEYSVCINNVNYLINTDDYLSNSLAM